MSNVGENIARVNERIGNAALRTGRNPDEVILVAVSKTVPVGRIREAIEAGLTNFGENYVQEARDKIEQIAEPVNWHMIGHLQTNKAKYVVPHFSLIHSVDNSRLAQEISKRAVDQDRVIDVLVQVNASGEITKSGVSPDKVLPLLKEIASMDGISVKGLMTMPPFFDEPEKARPYFQGLRELRDELVSSLPSGISLSHLSMGMSGDFEVAIEEGATIVRVGTAIFGARGS